MLSPGLIYCGLTKTVAAPESRPDDFVRFWTAAALCRFSTGRRMMQSGRGLPQSTTLERLLFARNRLAGHGVFETVPTGAILLPDVVVRTKPERSVRTKAE
jgi:hypothetical protein